MNCIQNILHESDLFNQEAIKTTNKFFLFFFRIANDGQFSSLRICEWRQDLRCPPPQRMSKALQDLSSPIFQAVH